MPTKLEALNRILATKASTKESLAFLTELGFKGLSLKSTQENLIKFWYKSYDRKVLTTYLGNPNATTPSIRYNFGASGVVAIWPNNMTVVLKNTNVSVKPAHVPEIKQTPEGLDEPKIQQSPNTPGSTENDNSKVPITHITPDLEARYKSIQGLKAPLAQMLFLKALWHFLNTAKFGGQLKEPHFKLLKNMGAQSMRLRGRWWPGKRILEIAPRLFNASQNFMVEVVLHEICHQAVSEIDKSNDRTAQGHGPEWERWMRKVGLNPLRFDPNDNATYMTPKELAEHEAKQAEIKNIVDKNNTVRDTHGLQRMIPYDNAPASIVQDGKLINGLLVCRGPNQKGREVWAFLDEEYVKVHLATREDRIVWKNTYADHVYHYAGEDRNALRNEKFVILADYIRRYYITKKLK